MADDETRSFVKTTYLLHTKAKKFCTVQLIDRETHSNVGAIGDTGVVSKKKFGSKDEAEKGYDSFIAGQLAKGYVYDTERETEEKKKIEAEKQRKEEERRRKAEEAERERKKHTRQTRAIGCVWHWGWGHLTCGRMLYCSYICVTHTHTNTHERICMCMHVCVATEMLICV
eukprot:GDKI01010426.1.p1 GENE.GDKI01010426.1~~GDKI01010426.1.p1  ORF type:complete len:171 (-),score=24.55 GDKI01010426.1:75-587(-)